MLYKFLDTIEEAAANAVAAKRTWLEAALEENISIPWRKEQLMDFILYNKHQPLCLFTLNIDGTIKKITEVYNEAYAPVGVNLHDRLSLYEWWTC